MKVSHILEAAPAQDLRDPELNSRLRIKREGDMVWHLNRFFDEGEESPDLGPNPEYQKFQNQIKKQALSKLTPKEQELYLDYFRHQGRDAAATDNVYKIIHRVNNYLSDTIEGIKGHIPEEKISVAVDRRYYPKSNLVVAVRKGDSEIPIRWLTVRIKKGKIMSISFESKATGTRDSKQFRVKQSQKIEPRKLFVVYQKLDY